MTRRFRGVPLSLALPSRCEMIRFISIDLRPYACPRPWIQFALPTPPCCGAAGRFSSAAGLARQPQLEHVHPDRARHRRGLSSTALSPRWPRVFPAAFRGARRHRAASTSRPRRVITTLVLLGQVLELRARGRTGGAIRALLDLAPKTARRVRADGSDEDVPLDAVKPGDMLRVRPGERSRSTASVIEGQQRGRRIDGHRRADPGGEGQGRPGDRRHVNGTGSFVMRGERVGARDAACPDRRRWSRRPSAAARPIQRLADTVSAYFVPAVVAVAVVDVRRLAAVSGPQPRCLRAGRTPWRPDHRLPLRARACHADVDHGRHGPRRATPAC